MNRLSHDPHRNPVTRPGTSKMTQAKLAKLSGIPPSALSYVITGKRTMTVNQARKFAKVLHVVTARQLLVAQVDYKLMDTSNK